MRKIAVVQYDPNWANEFEKIKKELATAVGDSALAIEHVGSTSVPGLFAKPIIDIDIIIKDGIFPTIKQKLDESRYTHVGDLGITGREAFKNGEKPHLMEHHLYVCKEDSKELQRHISLRDYLRLHDDDRDRYSRIKIELAQKFPFDIDSYISGKEPVILDIYKKCGL